MKTAGILVLAFSALNAQVPKPTQDAPAQTAANAPIYRITVVARTVPAINYQHRAGSTRVGFRGTELLSRATGDAKVESRMGSTKIEASFDHLTPATQFGPEYLTYVMWAITPEGRAQNLGEVVLDGDHSKLLATTELQAFGIIVTAEPYFAVTQPSDVVVMENEVRGGTTGTIQPVTTRYELLQRGSYVVDRAKYQPIRIDPKGPLQLAEARNAVEIAEIAGAERYAADTLQKARVALKNAEDYNRGKGGKPMESAAREAAQTAEDARIIAFRKQQEERMAAERASAEQARVKAAEAEQQAQQAQADRASAEQARRDAEAAAARATAEKAAAEQTKQQAQNEAARAQELAAQAEHARSQALNERDQLRERLRQQLNAVLETRETARGLIVNISDVLFDFNKYTPKPGAREKLAKVAGILLAYPGLALRLEGHTDSIGGDAYNMKLSQERADAVRMYLVGQGVQAANITAVGMGKADPVADNTTAAGRQQNRRVELVVSGEAI